MSCLCILLLEFEKTVPFEISTLQFVKKQSFVKKLSIFRPEFEKTIVTFEISALEFFKMRSFMQKHKNI